MCNNELWVHIICTAALNLSALILGQFKMGAFWCVTSADESHFSVPTWINSEYYSIFFYNFKLSEL